METLKSDMTGIHFLLVFIEKMSKNSAFFKICIVGPEEILQACLNC